MAYLGQRRGQFSSRIVVWNASWKAFSPKKTIDLRSSWGRFKRILPEENPPVWNTQPDAADAAETESRPAGQTPTTAHAFRMTLVAQGKLPQNIAVDWEGEKERLGQVDLERVNA